MKIGQEKLFEKIKTARKMAGITQAELANALGYAQSAISGWERGDGVVPAVAIPVISEVTKMPLEYFLLDDNKLPKAKITSAKYLGEIIDAKDERIAKLEKIYKNLSLEDGTKIDGETFLESFGNLTPSLKRIVLSLVFSDPSYLDDTQPDISLKALLKAR